MIKQTNWPLIDIIDDINSIIAWLDWSQTHDGDNWIASNLKIAKTWSIQTVIYILWYDFDIIAQQNLVNSFIKILIID